MGVVVEVVDTHPVFDIKSDEQITLEFKYPVAASTWTIVHKQKRYPVVTVVDNSGNVVWADIAYQDRNTVIISFSAPFAGIAYLN